MRPNPEESFESWCNRARLYEQGIALQKIAEGHEPEKVLEELSKRLVDKLLHPLFKEIRDNALNKYNAEQGRAEYYDNYLTKVKPAADHIEDNLFDKEE